LYDRFREAQGVSEQKGQGASLPLLSTPAAFLLELSLRVSDLSGLFCRKQVGHQQRSDLDMPRL